MGSTPPWVTVKKSIVKEEEDNISSQYITPNKTTNTIVTLHTHNKTANTINDGTIPTAELIKYILNKAFKQECPLLACTEVVINCEFVDNIKYDAPADRFICKSTTIILPEKVPQDFKT
eukprot:13848013-Ditylum_brightwellii.AAC.1